jgi:hypothetical protein
MLRTIMVCVLIGGAATGCASLGSNTTAAAGYCLTESGLACSALEGDGDCQPCPMSSANARSLSAGSPVDRSRTP